MLPGAQYPARSPCPAGRLDGVRAGRAREGHVDIDPDLPRGRGAPTERRGAEGRARPRGIADPEPRRVLGEPQSRGTPAVECLGDPGGGGAAGRLGQNLWELRRPYGRPWGGPGEPCRLWWSRWKRDGLLRKHDGAIRGPVGGGGRGRGALSKNGNPQRCRRTEPHARETERHMDLRSQLSA